jgi:hypothetical protein
MTTLLDLPPEIIDAVLLYTPVSHRCIDLWICGNRRLHTILIQGVTQVYLEDNKFTSNSRFPKMLIYLRRLRSLSVNRFLNRLGDAESISILVKQLSPTLETIKFVFAESQQCFWLQSSLSDWLFDEDIESSRPSYNLDSFSYIWDMKSTFPNLKTLKLCGTPVFASCDLRMLPPNLTSLNISINDTETWDYSLLPRTLIKLVLGGSPLLLVEELQQMPPGLTLLKTYGMGTISLEQLRALPRQLVKIPGISWGEFSPSTADALPPGITSISINSLDTLYPRRFLELLPSSLTELFLFMETIVLDHSCISILPKTLTMLNLHEINWNGIEESDYPPLKTLQVAKSTQDLDETAARNLPSSLRELSFTDDVKSSFDAINSLRTPLLEVLTATVPGLQSKKLVLPPKLKNLQFFNIILDRIDPVEPKLSTYFPLSTLPQSITLIDCGADHMEDGCELGASQFKHLPPGLTSLSIRMKLDIDDVEMVFAELPRNLNTLHIPMGPKLPGSSFRHLPPSIGYLSYTTHTTYDVIDNLPPNLTDLALTVDTVDNEWARKLPRNLRWLHVNCYNSKATIDSAKLLPINLSIYLNFGGTEIRKEFVRLRQARVMNGHSSAISDLVQHAATSSPELAFK